MVLGHFGGERKEHELLREIIRLLEEVLDYLRPQNFATTARLETDMALEVGGTATVTLTFVDNNGVKTAPPKGDGSGLVVTIASSDTAVATVGATTASGDTAVATVTAVSPGTFDFTATVGNSSQAPLLDDDGTTAFVQPSPLADSVAAPPPPQAVTAQLSVN